MTVNLITVPGGKPRGARFSVPPRTRARKEHNYRATHLIRLLSQEMQWLHIENRL